MKLYTIIVVVAALLTLPAQSAEKSWTALSVYDNGDIKMQQNITSEHVCREAVCYIQWSKSCSDHEADVKKAAIQAEIDELNRKKQIAEYQLTHPCTLNKDGKTKTCPTDEYSYVIINEDGKEISWSSDAVLLSSSSGRIIMNGRIMPNLKLAVCFQ